MKNTETTRASTPR